MDCGKEFVCTICDTFGDTVTVTCNAHENGRHVYISDGEEGYRKHVGMIGLSIMLHVTATEEEPSWDYVFRYTEATQLRSLIQFVAEYCPGGVEPMPFSELCEFVAINEPNVPFPELSTIGWGKHGNNVTIRLVWAD